MSLGDNERRNNDEFWVVNEKWEIIQTAKPAYINADYSKVIYNFMKKHGLSIDNFREKLNLCSPDEAKKRMEIKHKLQQLKSDDNIHINNIINNLIKDESTRNNP